MAENQLSDFLAQLPAKEGIYEISEERAYQHDESDYDRQYGLEEFNAEVLFEEARNVAACLKDHGMPEGARILEVGCGTGRVSVGLAMQPGLSHLLLTDPSPAFCRITRRKLAAVTAVVPRIDFGILRAEDVGSVPLGAVDVILLRSVLHHIADVPAFLRACASVLSRGGLLVCEEPYYEGYLLMGLVTTFLEGALARRGHVCSEEEKAHIALMVASMQYYCRRDVDKSEAEDKHLFRPDELFAIGRDLELDLNHYPNWRITISGERNDASRPGYFERFYRAYLRYCMSWPPEFAEKAVDAIRDSLQFLAPVETASNPSPHCFGTFVFRKR
jgi:ubiquinone/menaquinone biosynthesis C-methylase UbiE